ncbi:E3 ubiquitin-protein ligase MARCHF5-like [Teleopsis dalmanni]|uniref:E3 ubiquitin-protein ligase MARCHF5-like n=1 Tax=Teleopsis dalmanni TaxID=139649 RepID=UPI0018CCD58A|nr:E3 ubiquitin-protein ligase MARCHF5-like [Teleopsis dalmanni]XP_037928153.1 E3 ubiquitin-protein ligase MARCHF5-like [Teleopsis dalmanni]
MYTCRICFDSADNNDEGTFIHPCKCKGDTKWVHQDCLKKWELYKVKADIDNKLCCEICQTPYMILEPKRSLISKLIIPIEHVYYRMCAFFSDVNNNASLTDKISIVCLIILCLVLSQYKEINTIATLFFKMAAVQSLMALCIYIEMINYDEVLLFGLSKIEWINNSAAFQSFLHMQYGYESGIPIKTVLLNTCQAPTVGAICSSLLFLYMSCKIGENIFYIVPHILYRILLSGVFYIFCRTVLILSMQFIEHRRRHSFIFLEYNEDEQRIANLEQGYTDEYDMLVPTPVNLYVNHAVLAEIFAGMQIVVQHNDVDAAINILNELLLGDEIAEIDLLTNHDGNVVPVPLEELQSDINAPAENEDDVTIALPNNSQEETDSVNASSKEPAAEDKTLNVVENNKCTGVGTVDADDSGDELLKED